MLDRTVYWLFRLAILLTRPLPLRLGYWFGERVALLCYWVIFPRQRKALNANLAHVLQSDDARFVHAVARRSFRNFGKYVIEYGTGVVTWKVDEYSGVSLGKNIRVWRRAESGALQIWRAISMYD